MSKSDHNLVPLTFPVSGEQVRVVYIDGEPWWVAIDVCRELGIVKPRDAVTSLDGDYAATTGVADARGQVRDTWVVNEPGLYQLIFQSRKEAAKTFRKWIFEEVIPTIRKTGAYESVESREAKVLEMLAVGDSAYRRIEWAAQRKEIPSWVAQQFADSQGLLTDALGFPAVLTTSGKIDDQNGVGINRKVRFANGQQRSKMFKVATGRLPFKAPTFRRGKYRIVNHYPKGQARQIEGFLGNDLKEIDK